MTVRTCTIPADARPNEPLPAVTLAAATDTLRFAHPRPQKNGALTVLFKPSVDVAWKGKSGANSFTITAGTSFRIRLEGRAGDNEDFTMTPVGSGTAEIMIDGTY